jgi:hypothetical protein
VSAPNFIYLGPDKAGSSWLHEVLRTHPQVFLTPAKGLYFFDRYFDRGMQWYVDQFQGARREHLVRGEVCQDYLAHPEAADRMARCLDEVKLMVTLRDPAERAYSSYLHMLRSGWRAGTFSEALSTHPELLEHGRYATQLKRFRSLFGKDALHVAVFDDLQNDPQAFLDALTSWLAIEPLPLEPSMLEPTLPAGRARSVVLSRIASRGAHALRNRDAGSLVGRIKRVPLVQQTLYQPLRDDRPCMTPRERAVVQTALVDEVRCLDAEYDLDLARRWGWQV